MSTDTLVASLDPKSRNRISANSDDPGFAAYMSETNAGRTVHVFLNGEEVDNVVTADPGLGLITRVVTDEAGNIVISDDELLYEDLLGDVTWTAERQLN